MGRSLPPPTCCLCVAACYLMGRRRTAWAMYLYHRADLVNYSQVVVHPSLLQGVRFFFIYLFLVVLSYCCCSRASSSSREPGYCLVAACGLSLWWLPLLRSTGFRQVGFSSCSTQHSVAVAHGPQSVRASVAVACRPRSCNLGLRSTGSAVVARGLVALSHMGSSGRGIEPMSPALGVGVDSQPLYHQGSPRYKILKSRG